MRTSYDVVVVGSGPNGLTAATMAARRGRSAIVFEANETIGGGLRSAALTEAGCAPGAMLVEMGPPNPEIRTVGSGGGYGGIYCFALQP